MYHIAKLINPRNSISSWELGHAGDVGVAQVWVPRILVDQVRQDLVHRKAGVGFDPVPVEDESAPKPQVDDVNLAAVVVDEVVDAPSTTGREAAVIDDSRVQRRNAGLGLVAGQRVRADQDLGVSDGWLGVSMFSQKYKDPVQGLEDHLDSIPGHTTR
ncbi:hypothetical protein MMC29_008089 [Sticta canariensis]|nr:hypothetical protein [Sticta canariensis]